LTNMPLVAGAPLAKQDHCISCQLCINACPAGAITLAGYDKQKCADKLKEFTKLPGIGQSICGVCVKVCR
jgi:epoxyqueuosine reductase